MSSHVARPGGRWPQWPSTPPASLAPAWILLVRTVWHDDPPSNPAPSVVAAALKLACRNEVEGRLARAFPSLLAGEAGRVASAADAFRRNLRDACERLLAAEAPAVLIKADPAQDYTYSNFDLVVGRDGWDRAEAALAPWSVRTSAHPLERTKLLLHPAEGPAAHLHESVTWFDVPVIATEDLRSRAHRTADTPWLMPAEVDALRIQLAHAFFQNLAFTLEELLTIRALDRPAIVSDARRLARREGWPEGFETALATFREAASRLDGLRPTELPVRLPVARSLSGGTAHAVRLVASGRHLAGLREVLLRPALVAAKRRSHVA